MPIHQLYVDAQVADLPTTAAFSQRLKLPPNIVEDASILFDMVRNSQDPWGQGKSIIFLTRNKGAFIKKCPGTRDYTCCGYQILHIGTYCTMDCAYCILQGYFHPPMLQYFVNHEDLMAELETKITQPFVQRMGTGEFTDSLIWEPWADLTSRLVERFSRQDCAVLELKTKTVNIDSLKDINHARKTIVAWSLNTARMIHTQERGTAGLSARLRAAARCQTWGYPLAFHFDPLVIYPGCEDEYYQVLKQLFSHISADGIVWISMGTMRFMPALHSIIQRRFPESDIVFGEFIPGLDGKLRYFKGLRIKLYRQMLRWIKEFAPQVMVYLCMEDEKVWTDCFGFAPQAMGGLAHMLDESARLHCNLK